MAHIRIGEKSWNVTDDAETVLRHLTNSETYVGELTGSSAARTSRRRYAKGRRGDGPPEGRNEPAGRQRETVPGGQAKGTVRLLWLPDQSGVRRAAGTPQPSRVGEPLWTPIRPLFTYTPRLKRI
jgi:hypothetical protein